MSDSNSSLTIRVGVAGGSQAVADVEHVASRILSVGKSIATAIAPELLAFTAVATVLKAVEKTVTQVATLGDTLEKLHLQTGASVSSLTNIEQAFQRIGGSAEEVGTMVSKMQRNITDALTGSGSTLGKDFNVLGIDPKALSNLSADKQLLAIGEALNKIANDGQRAQIAIALFGRSGAQMLQIFRDPMAMKLLGGGASNSFANAMQNIAEPMHNIMAAMREADEIPTKVMAGVFEQLPLQDIQEKIDSVLGGIDWTRAGQKAGAFVNVVINAIKNGQLPEILSLVIQAGFELGANAVKISWVALWHSLTGATAGEIYLALMNAIMSFGVGAAKFLVNVLTEPIIYMAAGFDYLGDHFREVFEDALNWFIGKFDSIMKSSAMNFMMPGAKLLGSIPQISDVQPADSYSTDVKKQSDFAQPAAASINDYLTKQLQASQDILGINEKLSTSDNTRADAVARLNALINEQLQMTKASGAADTVANGAVVQGTDIRKTMAAQEIALKQQLTELDQKMAQVEGDYAMTTAQKYAAKKQILEQMAAILQHIIDANNKVIASPTTSDTDRQLLLQRNTGYQSQLAGVQDKESKLGPDPNSFKQQWTSVLTGMQNKIGTWATQTSSLFESVFNNAFSSIESNLDKVIAGTETWKKGLMEIGTSVVESIINGIIKMVVEMLVMAPLLSLIKSMISGGGSGTPQGSQQATQEATEWGAAAMLRSIADLGPIAGPVAFTAELAAAPMAAAAAAHFMIGGYTGDGSPTDFAGLVHKGEYVFSAPAVDRIGVDNLDALHQNAAAGGAATGGGTSINHRIIFVQDIKKAAIEALSTPAAEKAIILHVKNNKHKMGFKT